MKTFTVSIAAARRGDSWNRLTVGKTKNGNEINARLSHDEKKVLISAVGPDPSWKPSKYSKRPETIAFAVDLPIPEGASEVTFTEADLKVEYQTPRKVNWKGLSTKDVLEAFLDDMDPDAALSKKTLARLKEGGGGFSDRFMQDDVSIEFEIRSSSTRYGKTRFGVPVTKSIEKVTFSAGGWERHSKITRSMKEPTAERLSELVHKFEECKEFAFDRDQGEAKKRRDREALAVKQEKRRVDFAAALNVEELASKQIGGASEWTRKEWPNKSVSIDLKNFSAEVAARIVNEIDSVLAWVEEEVEQEKNKKDAIGG